MPENDSDSGDNGARDNSGYWRANINLMLALLSVWFVVSFVCGILIVDYLDQYRLFGYKLGFWFSQQGAIYFFVALIFIYAWRMNALDKRHGVDERGADSGGVGRGGVDSGGANKERGS